MVVPSLLTQLDISTHARTARRIAPALGCIQCLLRPRRGRFRAALAKLESMLDELARLFDEHGIRRLAQPPAANGQLATVLEDVIRRVNDATLLAETLDVFVYAFYSTNSYDTVAARETSKLEITSTRRQKLDVRLRAWIGSLAPLLPAWISERPLLKAHEFYLLDTARQSRYLMAEELEALAADLCLDGGTAFGKLQGNVTSQLKVPLRARRPRRAAADHRRSQLVVRSRSGRPRAGLSSRARRLDKHPHDRGRLLERSEGDGAHASQAPRLEQRAWTGRSRTTRSTGRRSTPCWGRSATICPMFRRYLAAKAKKIGVPRLRWWDLFAPLGTVHKQFTWSEARAFIVREIRHVQFGHGRVRRPCVRSELDRRRPARRQAGRGVLHGRAGDRGEPRADEFRRQLRAGEHAGARVGARLPQRLPNRAGTAAARCAVDAGRDGEHLLRNAGGPSRRWPARRRMKS